MDTGTWEELARTAYFEYAKAVGVHMRKPAETWESLEEHQRTGWRNSVAKTTTKLAQLVAERKA